MKAEELYNIPVTLPTPTNQVEAFIIGMHLLGGEKIEKGKNIARVPDLWMDMREAGVLFAKGFRVSKGWHAAYEPGWIIEW